MKFTRILDAVAVLPESLRDAAVIASWEGRRASAGYNPRTGLFEIRFGDAAQAGMRSRRPMPTHTIRHRETGRVIAAIDEPEPRMVVEMAVHRGISLAGADLAGRDLRGAFLARADLRDANLFEADLRGSCLRGADLRGANLSGADLRQSDLGGADIRGAISDGANGAPGGL